MINIEKLEADIQDSWSLDVRTAMLFCAYTKKTVPEF